MKNTGIQSYIKSYFGLFAGLFVFVSLIFFYEIDPKNPQLTNMLAVALLMAIWWITEAIPLAATALLPVALFPLLGIMGGKEVSSTYFNQVIFLFIGGFLVAIAMEKWNLHKRIALITLMITGLSPARILLGFMLATAILSMWISNTATTMMMVPILISIIQKIEENTDQKTIQKYSLGLLLGVAYSASIGGIATLVGTPPNLSFARIFQIMFPAAPEISFALWFAFAFPLAVVLFGIAWLYLYLIYKPEKGKWVIADKSTFRKQYKALQSPSFEEKAIFVVFISMAVLWMLRADISFGAFTIKGWSSIFSFPEKIDDGTVAIALALILFMIPSKQSKGEMIMNWEAASRLPWHIVLLFGGGFALASGFKESGLSLWAGSQLDWVGNLHPILIILLISVIITFLTELTSNTATTEMILPIMAGLSISTGINPLLLMIPATIGASMAFMLPVATPPNAIIFGTNRITVMEMAKSGLALNIIAAIVITIATFYWGSYVFNIDLGSLPEWASLHK
ncbi:MAG: SLC13 family permease [Ignavibacteria bacterium]|nr:SLC13 family permease [Ignavibacteria bacterium]